MDTNKHHIFLVGPSGVGKTSVGTVVAEIAGLNFVDLDKAIEDEIKMSIAEYFETMGENKFRETERQTIKKLSAEQTPIVFATGGGSVLDSRNIVAMKNTGYVVYLSALEKDIVSRLENDENKRPLLQGDLESKVHEQYLSRKSCYELSADIVIGTSNRDIETVANSVLRQVSRESGKTADLGSSIVVGTNLLDNFHEYVEAYSKVVLITQDSIPQSFRKALLSSLENNSISYLVIEVPDGEQAKSFTAYTEVIERMAQNKVNRNACVVALGGGVVGDLSGFVASTYYRGIDVVQVPTTLLAQVDSSIGGKCGINLDAGKNLVGSFHQPKVIVSDTNTILTLSDEDFLSGLGEVAKYAMLGNELVEDLINSSSRQILERDSEVLAKMIKSCMGQKLNVVSKDPLERSGVRATLNLGHTLAHAIETRSNYEIAHGSAVALGLRFISYFSFKLGRIPESQHNKQVELLDGLGLLDGLPDSCRNEDELIELMYSDKKSDGGLSFVLCSLGGGAELVHDVDRDELKKTLSEFIQSH